MSEMTQSALTETAMPPARASSFSITGEGLILLAIAALAIFTRFIELNAAPLQPHELTAVIAAMDNSANFSADTSGASPILRASHRMFFSLFGEWADFVRLPVALAGVALAISPWLFRALLGRASYLALCGLLLISPLTLFASRSAESVLLASLAMVFSLYSLYQFWHCRQREGSHRSWPLAGAAALAFAVTLTDGRGYLLAGSAALAIFLAARRERRFADEMRSLLRAWPWQSFLLFFSGSALFFGTVFLTQLDGLSLIGGNLSAALAGWWSAGNFLEIIGVSLTYEISFWLLALGGLFASWRSENWRFVDRFAAFWLLCLALLLSLDRGSGPQHASWLSMPLALLSLRALLPLAKARQSTQANSAETLTRQAPWLISAACAIILAWLAIQWRDLFLLIDPYASISQYFTTVFSPGASSALSYLLRIALGTLLLIALFLAARWFLPLPLVARAYSRTFAILLLVGTLGIGWRGALTASGSAPTPWLPLTLADHNQYFSDTLEEYTEQVAAAAPQFSIALVPGAELRPALANALRWYLRHYEQVAILPTLGSANGSSIIISAGQDESDEIKLSGSYRGQRFSLARQDKSHWQLIDYLRYFWRGVGPASVESEMNPAQDIVLWIDTSALP